MLYLRIRLRFWEVSGDSAPPHTPSPHRGTARAWFPLPPAPGEAKSGAALASPPGD